MVSLQFLHLPEIPQRQIIKHFDPIDIMVFSLLSKRCHALAKHVKIDVDRVLCERVDIGTEKNSRSTKIHFVAHFWNEKWRLTRNLDGVEVNFLMKTGSEDLFVIYDCGDTVKLYEVVYKHLVDLLNVNTLVCEIYCCQVITAPKIRNINCNCEILRFERPMMKSVELKEFLSNWKRGMFPRLTEMSAWWIKDIEFPWRMGKRIDNGQVELKNKKGNIGVLKLEPDNNNKVEFRVNPTN